jgi:hypothetical protein
MGFALKTWVGEFVDMRVEMLAREPGFAKLLPLPFYFIMIALVI